MVVEIRHEHSKRRVHIMRKFQREMTMAITRGYAAMLSILLVVAVVVVVAFLALMVAS
jgi:hypothetical protein